MRPVVTQVSNVTAPVSVPAIGAMAVHIAATLSSVALLLDTEVPVAEGAFLLLCLGVRSSSALVTVTHVRTCWLGFPPRCGCSGCLPPR